MGSEGCVSSHVSFDSDNSSELGLEMIEYLPSNMAIHIVQSDIVAMTAGLKAIKINSTNAIHKIELEENNIPEIEKLKRPTYLP